MPRVSHELKALCKSKIPSVIARAHQISAIEFAEVLTAEVLRPSEYGCHFLKKGSEGG
jgi:hypothetical protein